MIQIQRLTMTGLFDGKVERNRETVDREEILQSAIEAFMGGNSFQTFVNDTIDFHDISEEDLIKILKGEIKKIKTNTIDF